MSTVDSTFLQFFNLIFFIYFFLISGHYSVKVGLITAATQEMDSYKKNCIASSILGLMDCIPWAIQAFFQFSINRSA